MKYLFTKNATAQYQVPGLRFDPFLEGRLWIGVAQVGDEVAEVATSRYGNIQVITEEQYNAVKKNGTKDSDSFRTVVHDPSRPLHAQHVEEVVEEVATSDANAIDLLLVEEEAAPKPKPKPAKRATSKKKK